MHLNLLFTLTMSNNFVTLGYVCLSYHEKTSYYYFLLKEFLLVRVIHFHFLNSLRSLLLWPSQETRFEGGTFSLFCLF